MIWMPTKSAGHRDPMIRGKVRAIVLTLLAACASTPAAAEIRALLVGVSRYASTTIPDLVGPANDLTAMSALMRDMGAQDIVSLRDDQVSRSSVEAALQQMGRRAHAGDWILFYYSGHGAQAAARARSASDGAYDQFVLLPGFDPVNQNPEHFIVDKDFYAWMKRYVPQDVPILMMVDSCHSGSMHRAVDPRAFAFTARLALRGDQERAIELVARPGPRLPALQPGDQEAGFLADRENLPNLIYIGASRDDQLALETELPQEGAPQRGVLTFAFEQALSTAGSDGSSTASDLDGDGNVTVLEMSSYLNSQVRMLSAQRQESTAYFPSAWTNVPLFSKLAAPRPAADDPPPAVAFTPAPPALEGDHPFRLAGSLDRADFLWVMADREVVRRSGDVVASNIGSLAAFEGVIEKWRTAMALRPLVSELNMQMQVDPAGADFLYTPGASVKLNLTQPAREGRVAGRRYATIFNLASDGTVQLLYPLASDGEGALPLSGELTIFETIVVPPYGVDHVVAIATPQMPSELRAALRTIDGRRGSRGLVSLIRGDLKRAKGMGSLSIAELYTGE